MAGDPTNLVYMEQGGDKMVVKSGGEIDVESGGKLRADGLIASITVVSGVGTTDTADVVITALDADGVALTVPTLLHVWLTDLTTGLGGSAHSHSTGPAFTVGEEQVEMIAQDSWLVLTNAAGTCTLRLVDTANEDVTINAGVPGFGIRGSDTTVTADWS